MGVTAALLTATAAAGGAVVVDDTSRKARNQAKDQAKEEAKRLAALAAQPELAIPEGDDAATARAKRRSISAQLRRRGRQSTILTGNAPGGETLGG